ncbi:hypothetical protein BC629DRAFT_582812 [Irpex lacteus]|nr:hypothetical protein BC629DRAFT_582812 [Irpex lacteus]
MCLWRSVGDVTPRRAYIAPSPSPVPASFPPLALSRNSHSPQSNVERWELQVSWDSSSAASAGQHTTTWTRGLGAAIAEFIASLTEEERLLMIERLDKRNDRPIHTVDVAPTPHRHPGRTHVEAHTRRPAQPHRRGRRLWRGQQFLPVGYYAQGTRRDWYGLLRGTQRVKMMEPILNGRYIT